MLGTNHLTNEADGTLITVGTVPVDFDVVKTFARIGRDLAGQPDTASVTRRIVSIASSVTGCPSVALVRVTPSVAVSVHAQTKAGHGEIDGRILSYVRQGVAAHAAKDQCCVVSDDLTVEGRWPAYTPKMVAVTPIRSILAIPLQTGPQTEEVRPVDVLVFYAERAHYFSDEIRETASVLADQAAVTLAYNSSRDHAANLKLALKTSREIGAAIGILMERHKLTEDAAFEVLKCRSQDLNVKLHTVATYLNTSGELPCAPVSAATRPAG